GPPTHPTPRAAPASTPRWRPPTSTTAASSSTSSGNISPPDVPAGQLVAGGADPPDDLVRPVPDLLLGDLDDHEAGRPQRGQARGVGDAVGQRGVVVLALDLDHERQAFGPEVDPPDPAVAAAVDLAAHGRQTRVAQQGGEPLLEVARRGHVVVAPLVEQAPQHGETAAPTGAGVAHQGPERAAGEQPPAPGVVEGPGRPGR